MSERHSDGPSNSSIIITAQSGAQIRQNTRIAVLGCAKAPAGLRILSRRITGHTLVLKVRTPAAGRLTAGGASLRTVTRRVRKAATVTLRVRLSRPGLRTLRRHHRLRVIARVRFLPSHRGAPSAALSRAVTFRR